MNDTARAARLVRSASGRLVHFTHVPADVSGFQVRSTSCGRVVPATWTAEPVDDTTAVERTTCPTCHHWAQYHLDRGVVDAALAARLGAGWKDQPGHFVAAVDLEAAQQLLARLEELDGIGEQPVEAPLSATLEMPTLEQVRAECGRLTVRRAAEHWARASLAVPAAGTPALC